MGQPREEVHSLQKILPQHLQWCLLLVSVKGDLQSSQFGKSSSLAQNSLESAPPIFFVVFVCLKEYNSCQKFNSTSFVKKSEKQKKALQLKKSRLF